MSAPNATFFSIPNTFCIWFISQWKHWGCVTSKIIEKIRTQFSDATELDGFDELNDIDKSKIMKAYEEGHVADEDIPDSAKKPEGEEQPKQKAAAKKKTAKKDKDAAEDNEEQAEEKPKKKRAPKKKVEDNLDGEDEVAEEKPKKKRAPKKKDEDNLDSEDEVAEEKPKKARNMKKVCIISHLRRPSLIGLNLSRNLRQRPVRKMKSQRRLPGLAPR